MSGKKFAKSVRAARQKLGHALNNVDHWPDGWCPVDFLSPGRRVAIRLRESPSVDIDQVVFEADCSTWLEVEAGVRLLWFSPQEVLGDLDGVLARIGDALSEEVEWEEDEDGEEWGEVGIEVEDECPLFAPVDLPVRCRFCKNAV